MALQSSVELRLMNGFFTVSCFLICFQHKVLYDLNPLINFCNGAKDLTFVILIQIPYFSYSCFDEYDVGHTTDKMHSTFMSCALSSYTFSTLILNLTLKILVYTTCTKRCSSPMHNVLQVYWRHECTYVYICYKLSTHLANDLLHVNYAGQSKFGL
jgi:hypothetical protein